MDNDNNPGLLPPKKKYYTEKPDFMKGDSDNVFVKEKSFVEKVIDWWNGLSVKPFISIKTGPEARGGKQDVSIGISGTF